MTVEDKRLNKPGFFLLHRSLVGAAAADSTTISDANFPPADAFSGEGSETIWVTWRKSVV